MDPRRDPDAPLTTDTLLLASLLHVPPGSLVVDLGSGSGSAGEFSSIGNPGCTWLCIDVRFGALRVMMDPSDGRPREALAVCCRAEEVHMALEGGVASAVIANPPFGVSGRGRESSGQGRNTCRTGPDLLLQDFVRASAHLLGHLGTFLIVEKPSALPSLLLGCGAFGIAPVELHPVGTPGSPARRIVLRGVKDSRGEFVIHPQRTAEEIIEAK